MELEYNEYNDEYTRKLGKELDKFRNFNKEDGVETASEATTATRLTKKSGLNLESSKSPKSRMSGASPSKFEELDGGIDPGTINERDMEFDADYMA